MRGSTIPSHGTLLRILTPKVLNAAINRPDILPFVAPGFDSFDLSEFVADRRNVALKCGDAVAIFPYASPGVYEVHVLFPSSVRGKVALQAARRILNEMFTTCRADVILGHTPREFRAARAFNYALGFRKTGESINAAGCRCVDYELRRATWEIFLG